MVELIINPKMLLLSDLMEQLIQTHKNGWIKAIKVMINFQLKLIIENQGSHFPWFL